MSDPATPEPKQTRDGGNVGKIPWYLWPNLLGLDAVAVSVVWLWCFAVSEGVPLENQILRPIYLVLGLVVWLVYTADRLLDALRMRRFAEVGRS